MGRRLGDSGVLHAREGRKEGRKMIVPKAEDMPNGPKTKSNRRRMARQTAAE